MKTIWIAIATHAEVGETLAAAGVTKELAEAALDAAITEHCTEPGDEEEDTYVDEGQVEMWITEHAYELPVHGT